MISGWRRVNTVVDTPISIDATVIKNGDHWDMWYRDRPTEDTGGLYHAQSHDLYHWTLNGLAKGDINNVEVTKHTYQEGAYAFQWKGYFGSLLILIKVWLSTVLKMRNIGIIRES